MQPPVVIQVNEIFYFQGSSQDKTIDRHEKEKNFDLVDEVVNKGVDLFFSGCQ